LQADVRIDAISSACEYSVRTFRKWPLLWAFMGR
jgi:hypothetical protein